MALTNRFFKLLFALLTTLCLQSCFSPAYFTQYARGESNVGFTSGKYMLNNISARGDIQVNLEAMAIEGLGNCLGERLTFIDNVRGKVFLPNTALSDFTPEELKMLNATTGYDYLINIVANAVTKNHGRDPFTGEPPLRTEMRISIVIYDLKLGTSMYRQYTRVYTDAMHADLYKPDDRMYKYTLKKALKTLKKNSNCN